MIESDSEKPSLDEKLSELDELKKMFEDSRTKEKDSYDQLVRLMAEFENYRKRADARVTDARKSGRAELLMEVISLGDVLMQAAASTQKATDMQSIKQGMTLISQQFEKFLKDHGLVPIVSKGEKLDPHRHEVIAQDVNADLDEGTIVEEIQRGFMLNDRVIRPAKVRVSTKPAAQTQVNKEEKTEE